MAPDAGFEPATKRLTAAYSTAELIRNLKNIAQKKLKRNKGKILRKNRANVKVLRNKSADFVYFYFLKLQKDLILTFLSLLLFLAMIAPA